MVVVLVVGPCGGVSHSHGGLGSKFRRGKFRPGDSESFNNPPTAARHIKKRLDPSGKPYSARTAIMASRFFAASDSSSDESSEEELYSNGEESEQEDSENGSDDDDSDDSDSSSGSETGGANRFLKDAESDSESDDEDVNKVLKSAKDKRFDELEATVRQIENAQKINDWAVISDRTSTWIVVVHVGGGAYGMDFR